MFLIREESPNDHAAIAEVLRRAFGRDDEAELVERLRTDGDVIAALVATEQGRALGHVLFSKLTVEDTQKTRYVAALAPLAVTPERQGEGIGTALVEAGLTLCRDRGVVAVIVVGDPEYYRRFGFASELTKQLSAPFSGPALMALEIHPGALTGVTGTLRYPSAFGLDHGSPA